MKKKNKRKNIFLSPFLLAALALSITACNKQTDSDELTLTEVSWQLDKFVHNGFYTYPIWNNDTLYYFIKFSQNGELSGHGVNTYSGHYTLTHNNISISIGCNTEIYDETGFEEKMISGLNSAIRIDQTTGFIRLYSSGNTYIEFKKIKAISENNYINK